MPPEVQTTVAESSAAPIAPSFEVDRGPLVTWTPEQRSEFRRSGQPPAAPKPKGEEAAASSASEAEQAEISTATEADNKQETTKPKADQSKPHLTAKERISQLESTIEKIRKEAGIEKTPKTESSPVHVEPPQPKTVEQAPAAPLTRPKPTPEGNGPDGKPYGKYEDYIEDLADWKAEQRWATAQREQAQKQQTRELVARVEAAKARYGNLDEVMYPTLNAIAGDQGISPVVKAMFNDSDVLPDLLFTIGSKAEELASFVKMAKENPGKAIRYISLTESLIHDELSSQKAEKTAKATEPPAKPQTNAPKPPAEVGGRASAPGDELESAAKAGDFRSFKAEANRRYLAQLKS